MLIKVEDFEESRKSWTGSPSKFVAYQHNSGRLWSHHTPVCLVRRSKYADKVGDRRENRRRNGIHSYQYLKSHGVKDGLEIVFMGL